MHKTMTFWPHDLETSCDLYSSIHVRRIYQNGEDVVQCNFSQPFDSDKVVRYGSLTLCPFKVIL